MRGRKPISAFLLGVLAFFVVGTATIPGPKPFILVPMLGLEALMLVPVVLLALTSVTVLRDGVLTRSSAFGTKRLRLDEVREARLRTLHTKSGRREQFELKGPFVFRVGEQLDNWTDLREAILAGLPPGVRPRA